MPSRINGFTVAYTVAGGIILWSGIKGSTISDTARSVLQGSTTPPVTENITPDSSLAAGGVSTAGNVASGTLPAAATTANAAANQAIARVLAAPYGWSTGAQWTALVNLWNKESGWSNTAKNPTSGAYGIAQALGHGPTNQYPAGPANPPTSSATAQIAWGLNYIQQTYGNPVNAWAHEQANNWY